MIYTFYSYKGGVGRSMAVANMAELLCKKGLSVLIIDWDLEAPGLERYFPIPIKEALAHEGLMDMLLSYKHSMAQPPDPELVHSNVLFAKAKQEESVAAAAALQHDEASLASELRAADDAPLPIDTDSSTLEVGPEFAPALPEIRKYIFDLPAAAGSKGKLSLMTAGRRDGENFALYADTVRTFDWQDFYRNWDGELFFDWFREQLLDVCKFNVVLLDSRTGVTEMGGVCTYHLADAVVMFCAPNQQNITGTSEMATNFTSDKVTALRPERPLRVVIVPSRVEDRAEAISLDQFKSSFIDKFERYAKVFESLAQGGDSGESEKDGEIFWKLKIPHVPFFAFNEIVAVREKKGKAGSEDMVRAFDSLAQRMAELAPPSSKINQLIKQKKRQFDVYLSYATPDLQSIQFLAKKLKDEGINPYVSHDELVAGHDWIDELNSVLDQSHICAFIVGKDGLSRFQLQQLTYLEERLDKGEVRVFPILLPGAEPGHLPPTLLRRVAVIFESALDDPQALRQLMRGIRGGTFEPKQTTSFIDEASPFRGFSPYYEEHAQLFFGREKFVERMIESLRGSPLVAVVGKSGCGKTSVVNAGLIPRLHEGAISGSERWLIANFKPADKPFKALAHALLPFLSGLDEASAITDGLIKLDDPNNLSSGNPMLAISKVINREPPPTRVLLVIDQLEDFFRLCKDEALRERFLKELISLIDSGSVSVVLTLRSDAYVAALKHEPLAEFLRGSTLELNPMTREELLSAMIEPARKRNVEFEHGLPERIHNDLGNEPGNLPLLALTLNEMWGRRQQETLTNAAYSEIGGVQGCFVRHVEAAYNNLSSEKQKIARRILMRLAPASRSHSYTPHRRLTFAELSKDQEKARAAVNALADARIVVTGSEEGNETVELAYGDLLNNWGSLKLWLEVDRGFLSWRQRLQSAIDEWVLTDKDSGALLDGASLREAQRWLETRGDDLSDPEREYIEASAAFKKKTIFQAVGVLLAVLVLTLLAWLIISWIQSRERSILHSRQLAAAANAQLNKDPELSVLLAAEAARVRDTDEARAALKHALSESRLRATFDLAVSPPQASSSTSSRRPLSAIFSFDGKLILGGSTNGVANIWDSNSRTLVSEIRENNEFYDVLFSPDAKQVLVLTRNIEPSGFISSYEARLFEATSGKSTTSFRMDSLPRSYSFSPDGEFILIASFFKLTLWNASSGMPVYDKPFGSSDDGSVSNSTFSPDGKLIATVGSNGLAQLWETLSGKSLISLRGHKGMVLNIAFSADGKLVATAGADKTVKVWETGTGRLVQDLKDYPGLVSQVKFSPDGKYLVTSYYVLREATGSIAQFHTRVWETSNWKQHLYDLQLDPNTYRTPVISPNSKLMAMPRANTVALVNLSDGVTLFSLRGHSDSVASVVFSPDGESLLTAGKDMTVRLWDISSEQNKLPDSLPELLSMFCTRVSANMNKDEWAQYTSHKTYAETCPGLPTRHETGAPIPAFSPIPPQSLTGSNSAPTAGERIPEQAPANQQQRLINTMPNRSAGRAPLR